MGVKVSASPTLIRGEIGEPGTGFEPPVASVPAPDQPSGRGLFLVGVLADRWGVVRGGVSYVWFEMARRTGDGLR